MYSLKLAFLNLPLFLVVRKESTKTTAAYAFTRSSSTMERPCRLEEVGCAPTSETANGNRVSITQSSLDQSSRLFRATWYFVLFLFSSSALLLQERNEIKSIKSIEKDYDENPPSRNLINNILKSNVRNRTTRQRLNVTRNWSVTAYE